MEIKAYPGKNIFSPDALLSRAAAARIPLSGTFELTGDCNFRCRMCYVHGKNTDVSGEKSASWWIKTAENAAGSGTVFLLLTGGEPLIRKDFREIYENISDMGFIISLNTNASLFDDSIFEVFSSRPPSCINISLYGVTDAVYENLCGVKAAEKVKKNILTLKDMGLPVKLNCSLTPYNLPEAADIYDFARKYELPLSAASYMFPSVRAGSPAGENRGRFTPSEAARVRARCAVYKYGENEFIRRAEALERGIDIFCENYTCYDGGRGMKCSAGKASYFINSRGFMSPCSYMDYNLISLDEAGFYPAWEKTVNAAEKIVLPEKCTGCIYRSFCSVCAAACLLETGSFTAAPPYVCRFSEKTAEYVKQQKEILKEEKYGN